MFNTLFSVQKVRLILFKKSNSKYQIYKRSHDWLKVINYKFKHVGLRKGKFGLLLSFEDGSYAGLIYEAMFAYNMQI